MCGGFLTFEPLEAISYGAIPRFSFPAILEPDAVVKRQEALAAARLRMQEDLNAQVEKHKEKLRQV